MAMISAYLVDDITIVKSGGEDSWGEPLASIEYEIKGKIDYRTRLIMNLKGEAVQSSAMVILPNSIVDEMGRTLSHEDRIKFDDIEHVIVRIDRPKAFSDPHYEVFVS